MVLTFNTNDVTLGHAGGKGVNLCKLTRAGFPVPEGFIITTEAYTDFIRSGSLEGEIRERIRDIRLAEPNSVEEISAEIRSRFSPESIPNHVAAAIDSAYFSLKQPPVAVRSSATAEDLPGLSFAGQHDTYLNIIGIDALRPAIVACWSSLWTARAITYRERNYIPHDDISLAVIVQQMVASEASGVLFSANPVTGSRMEMVIEATLGLGEALVAGKVEPDRYIIDQERKLILQRSLGSKHTLIQGRTDGGVYSKELDQSHLQALPDEQIYALAELGRQIENLFEFPQDIEWAWADQQLYILQSRPITSLYPIPQGMPIKPLRVMFSFASVQGIFDPFTPLGQDTIRMIFAGGASLFGYQVNQETQGVIKIAGERLWGNLTPIIQHPIGARAAPKIFPVLEPGALAVLEQFLTDPEFHPGEGHLRIQTVKRLLKFSIPFLKRVLGYMRAPQGKAAQIQQKSRDEIQKMRLSSDKGKDCLGQLEHSIRLYRQIYNAFPYVIPHIVTGAAAGLISLAVINEFSKRSTGSTNLALEITRGLPHNVTTEMDLELWTAASQIQADPATQQYMLSSRAEALAGEYLSGELPQAAQEAVAKFLEKYGMRGLGEIDLARPRWQEDPTHILGVIQRYLLIEGPDQAPDVVFEKGAQTAERALTELEAAVRKSFGGGLKARIVRAAYNRVRELAGLRESPKFHIVEMMWIIRQALLESGAYLAAEGILRNADDIFFLYLAELDALANQEDRDWLKIIEQRRRHYKEENARQQIPRFLLSDGRVFYQGITLDGGLENMLKGSPVSPGQVDGRVRVVFDPLHAELLPGEIMVCQGTDPAWTPLFLAAAGLVMEMGGMMTHGAIVAREYGIPAVVGVDQATTVLHTGQRIQVNGSSGEIILLDN